MKRTITLFVTYFHPNIVIIVIYKAFIWISIFFHHFSIRNNSIIHVSLWVTIRIESTDLNKLHSGLKLDLIHFKVFG